MSLLSLLDPEKQRSQTNKEFDSGIRSANSEVFEASRQENVFNFNADAEFNSFSKAVKDISEEYLSYDKEKEDLLDPKERDLRTRFRSLNLNSNTGQSMMLEAESTMKALRELRPDLNLPDVRERAHKVALDAKAKAQTARDGKEGALGTLAEFAGGFAASLTDPIDLLSMFIPVGKAAGIGRAFLFGAAENAGVEVLKAPTISGWQKELGEKYGVREAVSQVAMAATFGGVMSGGGRAIGKGLEARAANKANAKADVDLEVEPELEQGNPDLGVKVNNPEPELKASDAFEELAANEKIPQEAREAFAIQAKHQRALEAKPIDVSEESHLKAIAEIELKMSKGEFPDIDDVLKAGDIKDADISGAPKIDETTPSIDVDNLVNDRFDEMISEIDNAQAGRVVTTVKEGNIGGDVDFKKHGVKSTFPKWFGEVGFKSKADFDKVIKSGKGVRFDRLMARAKEDLTKGYNTAFGRVPPNEKFGGFNEAPSIDEQILSPNISSDKASNLLEISNFRAKTARSGEALSQAKESLELIAKDSPDELVEVGGQQMKVSELNQRVKENENLLKALDICEVV